jgi:hypothetical protein
MERMKLGSKLLAGLFSVVTLAHSQAPMPQAQAGTYTITILGAVQRPGPYEIKINADRTVGLMHLWALAGGTTKDANRRAVVITRASNETIQVDLELILSRKTDDIKLEPGDVINVPSKDKKENNRVPWVDPPLRPADRSSPRV